MADLHKYSSLLFGFSALWFLGLWSVHTPERGDLPIVSTFRYQEPTLQSTGSTIDKSTGEPPLASMTTTLLNKAIAKGALPGLGFDRVSDTLYVSTLGFSELDDFQQDEEFARYLPSSVHGMQIRPITEMQALEHSSTKRFHYLGIGFMRSPDSIELIAFNTVCLPEKSTERTRTLGNLSMTFKHKGSKWILSKIHRWSPPKNRGSKT